MREVPEFVRKHRDQCAAIRKLLDEAKSYEDFESVKLFAETVTIQQRCERQAYMAGLCVSELTRRMLLDKKHGEAFERPVE